jgi:hypothetical protein
MADLLGQEAQLNGLSAAGEFAVVRRGLDGGELPFFSASVC